MVINILLYKRSNIMKANILIKLDNMDSIESRINEVMSKKVDAKYAVEPMWKKLSAMESFVVLSAFDSERTISKNVRSTRWLSAAIQNLRYGHYYVNGHWVMYEGSMNERRIKEDLIIAFSDSDKFMRDISTVAFDKTCSDTPIICKNVDDSLLALDSEGIYTKVSKTATPKDIGEVLSVLRGMDGRFVFESLRPATNLGKSEEDVYGWI